VDQLIGEMTGADRALISSLEGFEDLQLIGRMQLADHKIGVESVVICVTEGGETSSVIGTVLGALDDWKARAASNVAGGVYNPIETANHLFFVYNNPDQVLLPFVRSRTVIEEPGITKVNLTTGPQGITGSTRMQATSSETFVVASILQQAVEQFLRRSSIGLTSEELATIGFGASPLSLSTRLAQFAPILTQVKSAAASIGAFTEMESDAYANGRRATYMTGEKGLVTVFIDGTERSPTFRLFPLDTIREPQRKCWFQVWTPASDSKAAWTAVLGRPFKGLSRDVYLKPFETKVDDIYLRAAALRSLENAGDSQQELYDFSFADFNIRHRGPELMTPGGSASPKELAVVVLIDPIDSDITDATSSYRRFIDLFHRAGTSIALIVVGAASVSHIQSLVAGIPGFSGTTTAAAGGARHQLVALQVAAASDPMHVAPLIALKLLLNAHSTAAMARLGKVVGNIMINVSPSNLKLIGRATSLILLNVNDVIPRIHAKNGITVPPGPVVAYAHANACLYEMIGFLNEKKAAEAAAAAAAAAVVAPSGTEVKAAPVLGQTAEVATTIIWIIEAARIGEKATPSHALEINNTIGLAKYLQSLSF
jgi:N-acetylmuramic acid 6-phosphate etherase